MKPLCIDLFCGLGGWSEGFLEAGYECIGFDVERHDYGSGGYPRQLVLQDVLTLHGAQFRDAACIVASPPCQEFSYMSMPWSRAKRIAADYRDDAAKRARLTALFDACFRIQHEASAAAGRWIPMVVENVKGAQPWVGSARWHSGPYYFWGDVPALMPVGIWRKGSGSGRSWFFQNGGNARSASSHSLERKIWTAQAAKIPFDLAQHVAKCFKPTLPQVFFPCIAT